MSTENDLISRMDTVRQSLRAVHGVRGADLPRALTRARRVLPRRFTRLAPEFADIIANRGHPKLERMVDHARLARHLDALEMELASIDLADRRRTRLISVLTRAFALVLFVAVCFIAWMVWAGHV